MNKAIFTTVLALFLGVIIGGSSAVAKIKLNNERPTMKHVDKIEYYGGLNTPGIYWVEIKGVPCVIYKYSGAAISSIGAKNKIMF